MNALYPLRMAANLKRKECATILINNALLTDIEAGVLALLSGVLTMIHSKLGCEQYQGECKKLLSFYRGIAKDYANLQLESAPAELKKRFSALNDQLSASIKSSSSVPFE